MGKLYVIFGRSACGKSTIQKMLGKEGLIEVVSHTTRAKRQNEVEGIDYHYLTPEEFMVKLNNGEFLEHEIYNNWHYGTHRDSIDLSKGDHVIVATPHGFLQLRESLGTDKCVGIYMYIGESWELLKRSVERQPHASHQQCREICRRFLSDDELFAEVEELAILKVNNINARDTADIILRNIKNGL